MDTSINKTQSHQEASCSTCVNVGDAERVASIVAGGGMALLGLRNLSSLSGMAMTLLGGSLVYRGVSGHCMLYDQLGLDLSRRKANTAVPAQHGEKVEKCVVINRSPEEIYRFWRNFENLPRFMDHLVSVEVTGPNRSHWVAKGPLGTHVEWDAEIFNERPPEMIAWRSLPGSEVDTAGSVHFERAPGGRGTIVRVSLKYDPPGGKIGIGVAKLLGESADHQIAADLARLKQVLEAGELATTCGQASGRAADAPAAETAASASPDVRGQVIDEASDESFPASDPPAWTATSATDAGGGVDRYK